MLEEKLTINVVRFSWPEEQNDEEVATTEECDEEDRDHGALILLEQTLGAHGELRKLELPDEERDDQDSTNDEGHQNVNTVPAVLRIDVSRQIANVLCKTD